MQYAASVKYFGSSFFNSANGAEQKLMTAIQHIA